MRVVVSDKRMLLKQDGGKVKDFGSAAPILFVPGCRVPGQR
jgi:hypothetical protein